MDWNRGQFIDNSVNRQINFKTSILGSSLCDYSDAYTLFKGNISGNNTAVADAHANNTGKKYYLKIVLYLQIA